MPGDSPRASALCLFLRLKTRRVATVAGEYPKCWPAQSPNCARQPVQRNVRATVAHTDVTGITFVPLGYNLYADMAFKKEVCLVSIVAHAWHGPARINLGDATRYETFRESPTSATLTAQAGSAGQTPSNGWEGRYERKHRRADSRGADRGWQRQPLVLRRRRDRRRPDRRRSRRRGVSRASRRARWWTRRAWSSAPASSTSRATRSCR